jgi:hypothetical protein
MTSTQEIRQQMTNDVRRRLALSADYGTRYWNWRNAAFCFSSGLAWAPVLAKCSGIALDTPGGFKLQRNAVACSVAIFVVGGGFWHWRYRQMQQAQHDYGQMIGILNNGINESHQDLSRWRASITKIDEKMPFQSALHA